MSYRICYNGRSPIGHVEHSGGLTFCGREAGWYDGQLHLPNAKDALGYLNSIRGCGRCRASLAKLLHERERSAT